MALALILTYAGSSIVAHGGGGGGGFGWGLGTGLLVGTAVGTSAAANREPRSDAYYDNKANESKRRSLGKQIKAVNKQIEQTLKSMDKVDNDTKLTASEKTTRIASYQKTLDKRNKRLDELQDQLDDLD